jgi:hypothetical protein
MRMFVVDCASNSIISVVEHMKNVPQEKYAEWSENNFKFISIPSDFELLTFEQLTSMYDAITERRHGVFQGTHAEFATKLFNELMALSAIKKFGHDINLEDCESAAITLPEVKVRKVRDSKLQRMKASFLTKNEDGTFKEWSVKDLMEKCDTTERITHVYISTLRSPTDRFTMNIVKNKETNLFVYVPIV